MQSESPRYGRAQAVATLGGIVGFWGAILAMRVTLWLDRGKVAFVPLGFVAIISWFGLAASHVTDSRRRAQSEFRWIDLWLMRGPTREGLPRDLGIGASARGLGLPPRATTRAIWALGAAAFASVVVGWFVN